VNIWLGGQRPVLWLPGLSRG